MASVQQDDRDRSARAPMNVAGLSRLFVRLFRTDVAVVAGGQLLQQALTLLTGIAIGRFLGAGAYGVVNIARNIYTPLLILAPLGLDLALLKHVGRSDEESAATMDRVTMRLRLIVLLINLPVSVVGGLVGGGWLMRHIYRYPHFDIMLLITLLGLPIAADLAVLGAYYRGRRRPGAFALMTYYVQPVARVVLVGLAVLFAPNAVAVVAINTAQVAISAVFVWTHLARWRGGSGKRTAAPPKGEIRAEWREARGILRDSKWMGLNLFVYGMMRFADILILGAFAPAKVVGAYAALSTVSQLVQVWPLAASQTLGPTISKRYHAGDLAGVRKALDDYIRLASIMSGFLFAGIAAFGDRLDLVFGKSFTFKSDIAFLMPLGYLLSATLAPMGYSLSMTGRHRAELTILVAGAVFLLGACYVLAPRYGDVGAATAVCLTFAVINITRFAYVSRTLGFIPGRFADLAPPAAALLCAFAAKVACEALFPLSFPEVFTACVLYALAYGATTWTVLMGPEQRRNALARCARAQLRAEAPAPGSTGV
jgi:O-antigen/teichoic acid export membrane protein